LHIPSMWLLFFAITAAGFVWHYLLHLKKLPGDDKSLHLQGGLSIFVYWVGWWGSIFCSQPGTNFHPETFWWVGLVVSVLGIFFTLSSLAKHQHQADVDELITTGIYKYVRHPMYLGWSLLVIGIPLLLDKSLTLYTAPIWVLLLFVWAQDEERELEKKYGDEYREYKRKTFF